MDYLNKNKENLDEETYELYDRNIRLWGKENQIKLNRSYVLLINLNGVVTELAKNFVLSGVNLYLYDRIENSLPHLVELDDIKSNFFLDSRDLKKERGKVLKEKLSQINSYVSVEELESLENLEGVNIQSACLGFISFHTTVIKNINLMNLCFRITMKIFLRKLEFLFI
jgi:molybdopterin/thiamine biosynthesis adenylyltransferase